MPLDSERLRSLRLGRGLSQRQLGRMIGESGNTIDRLERGHGHARLTLGRVARIAQALAVHPSALIAHNDQPPTPPGTNDERLEAALLRSPTRLSRTQLSHALQLDRRQADAALKVLEQRLAGTGARLHHTAKGFAIEPREELLSSDEIARLERARIQRRALDRRALALLYTIFAGPTDRPVERHLGNPDRVALGRLLNARLVEKREDRYAVTAAVRHGLDRATTCGRARRE